MCLKIEIEEEQNHSGLGSTKQVEIYGGNHTKDVGN